MSWPFELPGSQPLYVCLFAATLAAHALLVGFVVGAAGWATLAAARRQRDGLAEVARAWLPFALGAGITAGVAPLLFLQLLYQERFYTANLLLGPRWMAIVPALVVGFYLLYLHKSARAQAWSRVAQTAVIGLAWACFVFVAWSWSTNHLLMRDDAAWRAVYAAGDHAYAGAGAAGRLAVWLASAVGCFGVGAAWLGPVAVRRLAAQLALGGIAAAAVAGAVAWRGTAGAAASIGASPWLPALVVGAGAAAVGAAWLWRTPTSPWALRLLGGGAIAAALAAALVREAGRAALLLPLRPRVEAAGGLPVFVAVALAVAVALVTIARIVRSASSEE